MLTGLPEAIFRQFIMDDTVTSDLSGQLPSRYSLSGLSEQKLSTDPITYTSDQKWSGLIFSDLHEATGIEYKDLDFGQRMRFWPFRALLATNNRLRGRSFVEYKKLNHREHSELFQRFPQMTDSFLAKYADIFTESELQLIHNGDYSYAFYNTIQENIDSLERYEKQFSRLTKTLKSNRKLKLASSQNQYLSGNHDVESPKTAVAWWNLFGNGSFLHFIGDKYAVLGISSDLFNPFWHTWIRQVQKRTNGPDITHIAQKLLQNQQSLLTQAIESKRKIIVVTHQENIFFHRILRRWPLDVQMVFTGHYHKSVITKTRNKNPITNEPIYLFRTSPSLTIKFGFDRHVDPQFFALQIHQEQLNVFSWTVDKDTKTDSELELLQL